MAHQVLFTRKILDDFIHEAMLTKDEEFIIRTRALGWSRQQQANELNISVQSVDRIIKKIKTKYDRVAENNTRFPIRAHKGAY